MPPDIYYSIGNLKRESESQVSERLAPILTGADSQQFDARMVAIGRCSS